MVTMLRRVKKIILDILSYLSGALALFGLILFVQAQIAPGTVKVPTFGPPIDVEVFPKLTCNWNGVEYKRLGPTYNPCSSGNDCERICANIKVECRNGYVVSMGTGDSWYNVGPTPVSCGTSLWN